MIHCEPMHAEISEEQCRRNQQKAAWFARCQRGYFVPYRNHDGIGQQSRELKGSKHWGAAGIKAFVHGYTKRCLDCPRYENETAK